MAGPLTCCVVSVGLWLTSAGDRVEKPCPITWENFYVGEQKLERARMPQLCTAFEGGVLLSRDSYIKVELKLAELTEQLRLAKEREKVLQEERERLLRDLRACREKGTPWCPAWLYISVGILGGYGVGKL